MKPIVKFKRVKLIKSTNILGVTTFKLMQKSSISAKYRTVCKYTADEYDDAEKDYKDAIINLSKGIVKNVVLFREEVLIGKQLTN